MLLATYVHDIDPFVFRFPGWLSWLPAEGVRWYGLSYLVGFVIAGILMRRITAVGRTTVKPFNVADMIVAMAIGVVLGGRLGYVVFYDPTLLTRTFDSFPYWGVLAFNQGGMASHGGIIGAILGCLYVARRGTIDHSWTPPPLEPASKPKRGKVSLQEAPAGPPRTKHLFSHVLDLAAFGTPIGLCFGRIANFINGELYGRACDATFALAVKFPQEITVWANRAVSRNTESPGDAEKFTTAIDQLRAMTPATAEPLLGTDPASWARAVTVLEQTTEATEQRVAAADLVYGTVSRVIDGTRSADEAARTAIADAIEPFLTARHPSQIYQSLLEGLALFLLLAIVWIKPRKPGVIAGWFMLGYGLFRIVAEQFRQPDSHLGLRLFDLTRGQWLSIAMPVVGIAMIVLFQKRDTDPMGGWLRGSAADAVIESSADAD